MAGQTPRIIFEAFLASSDEPSSDEFDRLARDHPDQALELRRLWDAHRRVVAALGGPLPHADESLSFFGARQDDLREPPPGVSAGQVLGDFRLVRPIGQGGMGQVWEAEQVSLRRRVALKMVRPERVTTQTLDLFAREARAGGRLHHPGIVSVFGHGKNDGVAWIAMEFVEGSWTLRDFLDEVAKRKELPTSYYRDVAKFVAKLADAIQAAHTARVIHRDLKPQNILVTPEDEPKVTDFGLARITDESALSVTGDFAGTYFYMSPEQVAAKRIGLDHRTDVFSLGVVLYEMLALRRPFEGDTAAQVGQQIVTKDPPDLASLRSRIPRDLAVITGKCLEKDRDRRYETMAELAAELRRHLSSEPIVARPPGRLSKLQLWARRNPAKSVTGAVCLLSAVIILVLVASVLGAQRELVSRGRDVSRLSALRELEDLVNRADTLWPVSGELIADYEQWQVEAEEITSLLPRYRSRLAELEATGFHSDGASRTLERALTTAARIHLVEAELRSRQAELAARRGGTPAPIADAIASEYPTDPAAIRAFVWPRVRPERSLFGEEGIAVALARAARTSPGLEHALAVDLQEALAWGLSALGRDQEAIQAMEQALQDAEQAGMDTPTNWNAYTHYRGPELAPPRSLSQLSARSSERSIEMDEERILELQAELVRLKLLSTALAPETVAEGSPETAWLVSQLRSLIDGLVQLADEPTGLASASPEAVNEQHGWSIPRRLELAKRMQAEYAPGGEWHGRWAAARKQIQEMDRYGGLDLPVQSGLVPLHVDSSSGLMEFWHVPSGEDPSQSVARFRDDHNPGIVLVLIPAGRHLLGAQAFEPLFGNYDPRAMSNEGPPIEYRNEPFFLSKYEMTQAQWERLTGQLPALNGATGNLAAPWKRRSTRLPVESVTWRMARQALARAGLRLPQEAEWEVGARSGAGTPWWTGAEGRSLVHGEHEYLLGWNSDLTLSAIEVIQSSVLRDGPREALRPLIGLPPGETPATIHVGLFSPNRFGLHDVSGNVREWCADEYTRSPRTLGEPAYTWGAAYTWRGRRTNPYRAVRGASAMDSRSDARITRRFPMLESEASPRVGVRPARAIDP